MAFPYITSPENIGQIPFRFLSTILARGLSYLPVTPNQVTIFRSILAMISLYFFSLGGGVNLLRAVSIFYVFEILDHVDGDLARLTGRTSALGPLLEQFVDTWASRPSNLFGFCIAFGMFRETQSLVGFILFGSTALGRMLWLEYRDVFGWQRKPKSDPKTYTGILAATSPQEGFRNLFEVLYIWNNTFLLIGALLHALLPNMIYDPLVVGFIVVAVLNNLPWMAITYCGFKEAWVRQTKR